MSGCYQFTGMPDKKFQKANDDDDEDNEDDNQNNSDNSYRRKRKKRRVSSSPLSSTSSNQTDEFISFCNRYAKAQKSFECEKMIPGAYTLGTGFDIKYENSENARRKSVILRYCNYQK